MKTYDFIFSNQPRHRISRHVIFWICWFVFIVFAYQIPIVDVFPNWNIKARIDFAQKKYGMDFITMRGGWANLAWEISYKQLRILLCHIAFIYFLIYYILPLYISNKKKWITTGKLILIFIAFFALHYFIVYMNILDSRTELAKRGFDLKSIPVPTYSTIIKNTRNHIFFNLTTLVALTVAIKLLKRWWKKQKETQQAAKEKISAELQLLKAQIHPHFLFNSINNIYSFALEASPRAPEMILKLSVLLHYMLYECKQPLVPLEKELKIVEDYISLEKIRYGDRLKIELMTEQDNAKQAIAPLLLIPFVENSFKHGASKMVTNPYVRLNITVSNDILYFKLINSRPYAIDDTIATSNHGLKLKNVKKRLELLYPTRYEPQILEEAAEYSVWMKIDLMKNQRIEENFLRKKEVKEYGMA